MSESNPADIFATMMPDVNLFPSIVHPPFTLNKKQKAPTKGTLVYAMTKGSNKTCKVARIVDHFTVPEGLMYKISIHKKDYFLSPKRLAHTEPSDEVLSIGTRVVALYSGAGKKALYLAGIVAEAPDVANKHRYLIFFDDGSTQYVGIFKVTLVYETSSDVLDDIPDYMRIFIRDYLERYPVRLKCDFKNGQSVSIEWRGAWWDCTVVTVDASLIEVWYETTNQTEWIYSGSQRIRILPLTESKKQHTDFSNKKRQISQDMNSCESDELKEEIGVRRKMIKYDIEEETNNEEMKFEPENEANNANDIENDDELGKMEDTWLSTTNETFIPVETTLEKPSLTLSIASTGEEMCERIIETNNEEMKLETENEANDANEIGNEDELGKIKDKWLSTTNEFIPTFIPVETTLEKLSLTLTIASTGKERCERVLDSNKEMRAAVNLNMNQTSDNAIPEKLVFRSTRTKKDYSTIESDGEFVSKFRQLTDVGCEFVPHDCSYLCIEGFPDEIEEFKEQNPFLVPMFCGWQRIVVKESRRCARSIFYRTPCGKRLRNVDEVHKYLLITYSSLTIDLFTFDSRIYCFGEFASKTVNINIPDLSYGIESVPLHCVNDINDTYPTYVEYTPKYLYAKDVPVNLDPNFLVCCDCDNDCADSENCACQQLTNESFKLVYSHPPESSIGYTGRRLMQPVVSGVYECNSRCNCSKQCVNRVVQNDVNLKLEVFKTSECGWGVRCKHDLPQGCFISLFTGQILTDQGANKDGTQFGDEYLAELDYIEVCENEKEGYEKFVREPDFDEDFSDAGDSQSIEIKKEETNDEKSEFVSVRSMFGDDYCYIMDAKFIGNVGRYLNHSCSPNVFVQSVFVDSHDLRFPWVAFFAKEHIRAGTELRWDYNYKIGSVPEKELLCHCGSSECRGRLL